MGQIGIWQVLLILVIVLILFGAGKLPKVMGDFGKGLNSFKKGLKEEDDGSTATLNQTAEEPVADAAAETIKPEEEKKAG